MKKIISAVIFMLCLQPLAVPCFASADVTLSLKAAQQPEENVTLSVNISKDSSLYTTEFFIIFNPDELKFIENSAAAGELTQSLNPYVTASEVDNGRVKVSYTATKPVDRSGTLCKLEFRAVKDAAAKIDIEVEHAETFDGDHIRSLTHQGNGVITEIAKQTSFPTVPVVIIAAVVAAVIPTVIIKKKKK